MSGERLAIVMPVYNEAAVLEQVVEEWQAALRDEAVECEWIAVDDGSTDSTGEVLRQLAARHPNRIRIMRQSNAGHGAACRRGYVEAARSGVDWVLQIDSDGQCDPRYFAEFWRAREALDCVFGRRSSRADGAGRRLVSAVCTALVTLIARVPASDFNVPYRLMRRNTLAAALAQVRPEFELQNVGLTVALLRLPDIRWMWRPIHFRARAGGNASLNVRGIVRLAGRMLRQRGALRA